MALVGRILLLAGPVLLIILTAIAGYAYSQIRFLALPIPQALGFFTVLLPLITGISTRGSYGLIKQSRDSQSQLTLPLLAVLAFQLFYETIIGTMALTYMVPPSAQNCRLTETWLHLFRSKNSNVIKRIQDNFHCCGLLNTHDQAWPFPKKGVDAHACEDTLGYTQSCINPLRQSQQITAGLFLLVAVSVFVLKLVAMIFLLTGSSWSQHPGWVRSFKQLTHTDVEDAHPDNRDIMRRLIDEGHVDHDDARYTDEDDFVVENGNSEEQGARVEPSPLADTDQWREETERASGPD